MGSPPLARGIRHIITCCGCGNGITPACAGNTPEDETSGLPFKDHPRLRGEYIPVLAPPPPAKGSPPLARGIHMSFKTSTSGPRITPACAGNTDSGGCNGKSNKDHPRLRGEYEAFNGRTIVLHGITPACAGNTTNLTPTTIADWDHPRLRGEYHKKASLSHCTWGSPPLARGIPILNAWGLLPAGITPACAGNTCW